MKLTPEQYRRGLLKWEADAPVFISALTTNGPGEPEYRSGPHSDSSGSIVEAPPGQKVSIAVTLPAGTNVVSNLQVRWERMHDEGVQTLVYEPMRSGAPVHVSYVPNYGVFHRLVVSCSALTWEADAAYRVGDAIVRFHTGGTRVEVEHAEPEADLHDGKPSIRFDQETTTVHGRLIDIVAPGDTPEQAELRAFAALGLIALILGDNGIGEIRSSEPYDVQRGGQLGTTRVYITARFPRQAAAFELDQIDFALARLVSTDKSTTARLLALRWYEKGLRSVYPIDRLLAFFIAMETIVSTHADIAGPLPQEVMRENTWKPIFDAVGATIDASARGRAFASVVQASLGERFGFYVGKAGLPASLYDQFRIARDRRNDVIHGKLTDVQMADASEAERLAAAILKHELGLLGVMAWESHPRVLTSTLNWQYSPRQTASAPPPGDESAATTQYQKISFRMDLTKSDGDEAEFVQDEPQ